eukprot:gene9186-9352_t
MQSTRTEDSASSLVGSAFFRQSTTSTDLSSVPAAAMLADELIQQNEILHERLRLLSYIAQMLLDCLQVVAVVLALNVMWRTPDWLPAALSGLLITQQHTWQWVSLDCLLPAELLLSPAVFNSIGVILLPGIGVPDDENTLNTTRLDHGSCGTAASGSSTWAMRRDQPNRIVEPDVANEREVARLLAGAVQPMGRAT